MKYISLLLFLAITFTLSGCFTRGEVEVTWSGSDTSWEEEISEDVVDEENNEDEELEDMWENNEENIEESQAAQENLENPESNNDTQTTNIETETSVDGSIETEELKSYEEDLEELFKDILGEIDANE